MFGELQVQYATQQHELKCVLLKKETLWLARSLRLVSEAKKEAKC